MMTPSLSSSLLFCLFSFLFGGLSFMFRECQRGAFCALRLLPRPCEPKTLFRRRGSEGKIPPSCETDGQKDHPSETRKNKKSRRKHPHQNEKTCFFGYLLFDLSFFVLFGICYMLFLYAENEGIFRVYAFLLTALGFGLTRHLIKNKIAAYVFAVLSLPFFFLGAVISFFRRVFLRFVRLFCRARKKDTQKLD